MKLLKAPLYAVSDEWEHNGPQDSDFYRTMYDPNTDTLRKVETWSTRYGCGYFAVVTFEYAKQNNLHGYQNHPVEMGTGRVLPPNGIQVALPVARYVPKENVPERVLQRAQELLAALIYNLIRAAEHRDILEPKIVAHGNWVSLTEEHNSRKTKQVLPVGTEIRVNSCQAYGTFYRNGYNRPGRENSSIVGTVKGHVETLVRVPLSKCRLAKPLMSDEELRKRAVELAANRRFEQAWGKVF